jgi:Cu2+-exporting ATPase
VDQSTATAVCGCRSPLPATSRAGGYHAWWNRRSSQTQILADKAAGWLFILRGRGSLAAWIIATGFNIGVITHLLLLNIRLSAYRINVPLVVSITTAMGASNGILVRDRLALERMRLIDTVLFDKTGIS